MDGSLTRDGLGNLSLEKLNEIAAGLGVTVPAGPIKFTKGNRITITGEKEKLILKIWLELCSRD